jgi:monofunctional biosynthetic peptidoglycan transglycosylase
VDFRNAVLAGEDFSFYSHNGVDWFEVRESMKKNLRQKRFARGASTITQQLAKNLFLSREKTIKRKLRELILTRRLEDALTKDRILELYLNVVELGEMVYGAGQGSLYHFGKDIGQISLRESAFLAAMLPGPKTLNPEQNMDRVMSRSDHILSVMLKGHMITEPEYLAALNEIPLAGRERSAGDTRPARAPAGDDPAWEEDPRDDTSETGFFTEPEPQPVPVPEGGGRPKNLLPTPILPEN